MSASSGINVMSTVPRKPSTRTKILMSFRAPKAVALTFDDGPDPDSTPKVLEILKKYGAKATFFVLGRQAELYPELVQEIVATGSEVCNHSYAHPSFSFLSNYSKYLELRNCERAIGKNCKKYFRPPYGHARGLTPFIASLLNYTTVGWTVEARDWEYADPATIAQILVAGVTPGAIVLLHDRLENARDPRAFDRTNMLAGLDMFLSGFATEYSFPTISELVTDAEAVLDDPWDASLSREQMETVRRELSTLINNPDHIGASG